MGWLSGYTKRTKIVFSSGSEGKIIRIPLNFGYDYSSETIISITNSDFDSAVNIPDTGIAVTKSDGTTLAEYFYDIDDKVLFVKVPSDYIIYIYSGGTDQIGDKTSVFNYYVDTFDSNTGWSITRRNLGTASYSWTTDDSRTVLKVYVSGYEWIRFDKTFTASKGKIEYIRIISKSVRAYSGLCAPCGASSYTACIQLAYYFIYRDSGGNVLKNIIAHHEFYQRNDPSWIETNCGYEAYFIQSDTYEEHWIKPIYWNPSIYDFIVRIFAYSASGSYLYTDHLEVYWRLKDYNGSATVYPSESAIKTLELSDSISIIDLGITKSTTKILSDSLSLGEMFSKVIVKAPFTEMITLTDLISKSITKPLTDSLTISDLGVRKSITKPLTDLIGLTEVFKKTIVKSFTESISLSEVITKEVLKMLIDSISLKEYMVKEISKAFTDSITLREYMGWVYPYLDPKKPLDRLIAVLDTLDRAGYKLEQLLDDPYIIYLIRYMAKKGRGEI